MKIASLVIFRSLVIVGFGLMASFTGFCQTNTIASGNWNTAGNWSGGVPGGASNTTVNHAMTINTNISTSSGDYIIYSPITDVAGGTAYNLSVSGTGGNQGNFDVRANSTFEGTASINGNGTLTVRSGTTLTLGATVFANNCVVVIEPGATLIINGDLTNNNNSTGITINGALVINGNFTGGNGSIVAGSGTFETSGTITNEGSSTVMGSNNDCTTGPCSGNNLCVSNTVGNAQSICAGQTPAGLTGSAHGGYTYQWQSSSTSSSSGFSNISGAIGQNYSPEALTSTNWFRRIASSGGCVATSVTVQVTVNSNLAVGVSIAANPSGSICSGTNVTFTATPVNGGTPTYQWKVNGTNVGVNSSTYSSAALANGAIVTCEMNSSAACPTGNPAVSNSLIMSVSAASGWLGATSSDWNTASNWCGGIPTALTNVVISSGVANMPQITAGAVCNQLTINAGASFSISSLGTLSVGGNIINNGTFSSNGTVILNGTSLQDISGVNFNHLTLNNASGCNLNTATIVLGTLTLTSGQLNSNGNLTIDLNTGAISGTGTGSIAGNITIFKNVNSAKYHYISSPLSGITANEWNDDVPLSFGQYANLYSYNEAFANADKAIGWEPVTSLLNVLSPMKGYALYFKGATSIDVTGSYNHSLAPSNITLTNTISSDPASDGWNLIGNPYPSTLNWDASGWTKTNIGNAIYYWDPVNSRYATYVGGLGTNGGTRFIPAMQSFWVKVSVSGGTGTFGMNNNVRTTSTNPSIWRLANTDNILRLRASNGIFDDETVLRFRDDAENTFDQEVDAYKMTNTGNTPSIYTHIGDDKYSINSLADTSKDITVPLHLKVASSGEYTIQAEEEGMFDASYSILLEDRILDSIQDLRFNPTYTFSANVGDTSGRFYISFRKSEVTSINTAKAGSKVAIRSSEHTVYFDFNNTSSEGYIGVYNLLGSPVAEISNADISSGKYLLEFPGETGIYIVKTVVGGELFTQKVYLK